MTNKKEKLNAQSRREEEALNRVLLWIGGAALLIVFTLFLNRYYVNYSTSEIMFAAGLSKVLPILSVLAVLGFLLFGFLSYRSKQNGHCKFLFLSILCLGLSVCSFLVWRFSGTAIPFLCGTILSAAVLALVYYLYPREFFLISFSSALGILGLWLIRRAAGTPHTVLLYSYLTAAALLLALIAFGTWKLQKENGVWKDHRLFHKKAIYPLVYLTCALIAVLLAAGVILGGSMAYYLLFAVVVWVLIMAVYFTVKLL